MIIGNKFKIIEATISQNLEEPRLVICKVIDMQLSRWFLMLVNLAKLQIGTFGRIFGKAMQAQSAIAVVNTALTAVGLLLLRVSGVGLLSVLVFLCSFVPVAGVIISTVPIGFVAFTE